MMIYYNTVFIIGTQTDPNGETLYFNIVMWFLLYSDPGFIFQWEVYGPGAPFGSPREPFLTVRPIRRVPNRS